jgi:phosphoribosylformimino-5-aminoimidazole carboxamide ribotide isomerase
MEFRPCIDIHNGKVKQIVGSTLKDEGNRAKDNFVSDKDAAYYASLYKEDNLPGGHVILLNKAGSEYYEQTKAQAFAALAAYPGGMQVGGGIHADNAPQFLEAGAGKVIVTSYVFQKGRILYDHLDALRSSVGREHVVLDLSCRRRGDDYFIVTDRWQKMTEEKLSASLLKKLEPWASEFLVHAADVEGKQHGIEEGVVSILGAYDGVPVTYAGGVRQMEDLDKIRSLGNDRVNVTIGSALDLFGGPLSYELLKGYFRKNNP